MSYSTVSQSPLPASLYGFGVTSDQVKGAALEAGFFSMFAVPTVAAVGAAIGYLAGGKTAKSALIGAGVGAVSVFALLFAGALQSDGSELP
jgi:hypothetical protein